MSKECSNAAKRHLDRNVIAQAWIRRHKNDDPKDRHLYVDTFKEDADKWLSQFKPGYAWLEPLVSIEAIAKQWEEAHGLDKHGVAAWLRSNAALTGGEAVPVESTVMQRKD